MKIGDGIAFWRRERGLTQEELGRLVGVSSQAVSKWENGGAPDMQMLPDIADSLRVSIDTLFGRNTEHAENITEALARWLAAVPADERLYALFELLGSVFTLPCRAQCDLELYRKYAGDIFIADSCYATDAAGNAEWLRAALETNNGLQLGVLSKDFPMYLLLPEPPDGFASNFADNADYRRLFTALAMPGALELLLCLYSRKATWYSASAAARYAKVSKETAEQVLAALAECNLLQKQSVEMDDDAVCVYAVWDSHGLVPLLYFARWVMEDSNMWRQHFLCRDRPILVSETKEV